MTLENEKANKTLSITQTSKQVYQSLSHCIP